jgi:hypothetical protein
MTDDRPFLATAFFNHLRREGVPEDHLEVYREYFDFLIARLPGTELDEFDPETIYQPALAAADELEGEEVVETYFKVLQFFLEFWAERWEGLQAGQEPQDPPLSAPPRGESEEAT